MNKRYRDAIGVCAAAGLAAVVLCQPQHYKNPYAGPIVSPRPLVDVAEWLQSKYAKVITYEELMPQYRPAMVQFGADVTRKWTLFRAPVQLDVSAMLSGAGGQSLGDILANLVSAANTQIPIHHFILKSSDLGYHIIMDKERDRTGTVVDMPPILDATITVPIEERTLAATLQALAGAITQSTGINIDVDTGNFGPFGFERAFTGGEPPAITWGAQAVAARDALISLLKQSATTASWQLLCQPSAQPSDQFCVLGITQVFVTVTNASGQSVTQPLNYDRCIRCPRLLPKPPGSPPPPR